MKLSAYKWHKFLCDGSWICKGKIPGKQPLTEVKANETERLFFAAYGNQHDNVLND
jgi:hypothetical protein